MPKAQRDFGGKAFGKLITQYEEYGLREDITDKVLSSKLPN